MGGGNPGFSAADGGNLIALAVQRFFQHHLNDGIIVDDKNLEHARSHNTESYNTDPKLQLKAVAIAASMLLTFPDWAELLLAHAPNLTLTLTSQ